MSELKKWKMNDLFAEFMHEYNNNLDKLNEKIQGELIDFGEVKNYGYPDSAENFYEALAKIGGMLDYELVKDAGYEGSIFELYSGLSRLSDLSYEWANKRILRTDDFIEYAGYPYQSQLTLLQEILLWYCH